MIIDGTFEVRAPIERVWPLLKDVPKVAPCIPGAQLLEQVDANTYRVLVPAGLGPVQLSYRAQVSIESVDDAAHQATLRISGMDAKGRGGIEATARCTAQAAGGGTRVDVSVEAKISGILATLGGGLVQGATKKKLVEFGANLERLAQA